MLFLETLNQYQAEVSKAISDLFESAFKNQTHPQDLLLLMENGFIVNRDIQPIKGVKLSPYVVGPDSEGWSARTQYEFYHSYRQNVNEHRAEFIQEASKMGSMENKVEYSSMHIELMIYIKFWEAEKILKTLYQLSRLSRGLDYDWEFKVDQYKDGRQGLIRDEIRDSVKAVIPTFYNLVKDIYMSQVRNAIAHSQFAFIGRNLNLNNKHLSKFYTLRNLTFEEWEVIIHKVILFYNELIYQEQVYYKIYSDKSLPMHYGLPLRTPKSKETLIHPFYKYVQEEDRWSWYANLSKH